jgi:hypothetical protein
MRSATPMHRLLLVIVLSSVGANVWAAAPPPDGTVASSPDNAATAPVQVTPAEDGAGPPIATASRAARPTTAAPASATTAPPAAPAAPPVVELPAWTKYLPSLSMAANAYVSVLAEFVWWERSAPTGRSFVDKSLDLTLYAHF